MRLIFIGVHNKPNTPPLCSSTYTGKIVNRIAALFPGIPMLKTNLFDTEEMPVPAEARGTAHNWYDRVRHIYQDDIIICLGSVVKKYYTPPSIGCIYLTHPASVFGNEAKSAYINEAVIVISRRIEAINTPF